LNLEFGFELVEATLELPLLAGALAGFEESGARRGRLFRAGSPEDFRTGSGSPVGSDSSTDRRLGSLVEKWSTISRHATGKVPQYLAE